MWDQQLRQLHPGGESKWVIVNTTFTVFFFYFLFLIALYLINLKQVVIRLN